MSQQRLASVTDVLKNLPLKFRQNQTITAEITTTSTTATTTTTITTKNLKIIRQPKKILVVDPRNLLLKIVVVDPRKLLLKIVVVDPRNLLLKLG